MSLPGAVARGLRDLARPRVLAVLFVPMVGAILLWSVLAALFWSAWTSAVSDVVQNTAIARWIADRGVMWALETFSVIVVIALLVPATLITAVLITELVAMPVVVSVAGRKYPTLERRSGGTMVGSFGNALVAVSLFGLLWLVTLPLWLTGIGAVVLPALNSAYLNQRLFRYDALAEHASRDEYLQIVRHNRGRLYVLGLILAPLYYVPFLNLAAPVLAGLAFTHFCLAELEKLRHGGA
jgi:uncharacterized protein involved in cysteine biosynthesis